LPLRDTWIASARALLARGGANPLRKRSRQADQACFVIDLAVIAELFLGFRGIDGTARRLACGIVRVTAIR
jgi:hypothetical protein